MTVLWRSWQGKKPSGTERKVLKVYQNFKREKIDSKHSYLPIHYGTFGWFVDVGGRKRRFLLYIPDGVRESCPGVLVLGENGKTADDLLNESG